MSEFYDEMQALATELLTEFGEVGNLVIKRNVGTVFNPVTGKNVGGSVSNVPAVGVVISYDDKSIDGTRIKMDDRMVVMDFQVEPQKTDSFVVSGADMKVVRIQKVAPSGQVLIYKVQVRA